MKYISLTSIYVTCANAMVTSEKLLGNKDFIRGQLYYIASITYLMFLYLVGDISLAYSNPLKRTYLYSCFSTVDHILSGGGFTSSIFLITMTDLAGNSPFFASLSNSWLSSCLYK